MARNNQELGLAEAIEAVRRELLVAQAAGTDSDLTLEVDSAEIELTVEIEKSGTAEASVKVLNIVNIGGAGTVSRGDTNRVKVVLKPIDLDGRTMKISDHLAHRPDGDN